MRLINNINTNTFTNGVRNGTAKIPTIDLVNTEFSISFKIKLVNNFDTAHSGIFILGEDERIGLNGSLELYCVNNSSSNKISVIYRTNSFAEGGTSVIDMNIGIWYNITIVVNSTSLNVFTNNVITKTSTFTNGLPDGIYDTNYFGCFNNTQFTNTKDDYLIDDFRIYNKALSDFEIKQIYSGYTVSREKGHVSPYSYYWNGSTTDNNDNAYIEAIGTATPMTDITDVNSFTISYYKKLKGTISKNTNLSLDFNILSGSTNRISVGVNSIIETFTYTSDSPGLTGQTQYDITFNKDTVCDILIVGGGGGGGTSYSSTSTASPGGGGAGGLIFLQNQSVDSGTYKIKVGKGGEGDVYTDTSYQRGKNGHNSSFSYLQTEAIGGGGGGSREGITGGDVGGSGGGTTQNTTQNTATFEGASGTTGNIVKSDGTILISNYIQGKKGGDFTGITASNWEPYGSGGGGAYEEGKSNSANPDSDDGNGGNGKADSVGDGTGVDFKTHFGITNISIGHHINGKVYFAGGGGNGYRSNSDNHSVGGLGGGASSNNGNGNNGLPNTGGGGSGSKGSSGGTRGNGGNGGSGIVIIRYSKQHIKLNDTSYETNVAFDLNVWYRWTFTYDGTNVKIYMMNISNTALKPISEELTPTFTGWTDETFDKILIGGGKTNLTDGLIAHYKFDGDWTDSSGNNNDLVVGGGSPTFNTTDSVIGQSANFLDGNNWVKTNSLNFDGGNWCFALWYKSTQTSSSEIDWILWQTPNANSHYGGLYYHTNGIYEFHLNKASTYFNQVTSSHSSYASDKGSWVHIVVQQRSDGYIELYRNSVKIETSSDTTITNDFAGTSMDFGYFLRGTGDAFGLMDDFRWYNKVLTENEINILYNNSLPDVSPAYLEDIRMYNTSFTEEDVKNLSLYNIPTTTTVSSGSGTVDISGVGTSSYVLKLPEAPYGGYKDHINDLIIWYKFEETPNGELRNYGKDSKYYGIINNSGIAKPELNFSDSSGFVNTKFRLLELENNKLDKIHILDTNLKYDGTDDSNITYTVTPTSNINVDILVVGGGGGSGLSGGGGGDVEYIENYELIAGIEYIFKVGKGGDIGNIGGSSEMSNINGSIYKVLGGGNGGSLVSSRPIASATSGGGLVSTNPLEYHSPLLALGKGFTGGNYYYEEFEKQINTISKDDNSLIAWYKFEGTDETSIGNDISGNGNNLILKNSGNANKTGSRSEVITGKYDNGFKFDGNEYFQYNQSSGLKFGLKNMSYSLWFNPNNIAPVSSTIISIRGYQTAGWSHYMNPGNIHQFPIQRISQTVMYDPYGSSLVNWKTNDFNHLCYVFSEDGVNTNVKIYMNNILDKEFTIDYKPATTAQPLQFGASDSVWSNGLPANMIISDIRIYNKALTAEQVNLLYTTNDYIAPPTINYAGGGGGSASSGTDATVLGGGKGGAGLYYNITTIKSEYGKGGNSFESFNYPESTIYTLPITSQLPATIIKPTLTNPRTC